MGEEQGGGKPYTRVLGLAGRGQAPPLQYTIY